MRCKVEEYEGGAVLDELLAELPGFYFSFDYLKMLASASKTMLRAVRDRRHWQGKLVTMNTEEFQLPMKLRWMMEAYMSAHVVTINVRQLTMFTVFLTKCSWTGARQPCWAALVLQLCQI